MRTAKYSGKKIGMLAVLENNAGKYRCQCECGKEFVTRTSNLTRALRTNSNISCGCKYWRVKVGQKFSRLIVLAKVNSEKRKDGKGSRGRWKCKCECGKIISVLTSSLTTGHTKSCGCLNLEKLKKRKLPLFSFIIKKCSSCKKQLNREHFGLDLSWPGGLKSICKSCNYKCKDYSKVIVNNYLRKKKIKQVTPHWVKKEQLYIIHSTRILLQEILRIELSVDHIFPIVHKNFSGLNIPENLQITTHSYNSKKSNRVDIKLLLKEGKNIFKFQGVNIHSSVLDLMKKEGLQNVERTYIEQTKVSVKCL